MIYISVILLCIIFVYIFDIRKAEKYRKEAYFFLFCLSVLIAGCRYYVGGDTIRYMRYFESYPLIQDFFKSVSIEHFNPLWLLLSSIVKTIYNNFIFFQFIHAIIFNGIIFYFFKKNTTYIFSACLVYYIFFFLYYNTEVLRESLSVCLFLLSIPFYEKKKWWKYYVMCTIALLFHTSSIILYLLPVFRNVTFSFVNIVLSIIITFFFSVIFINLMNCISGDFQLIIKFEQYRGAGMNLVGTFLQLLKYLFFPLLIIVLNNRVNGKKMAQFQSFYMAYIFVSSLNIINTMVGERLLNYFYFIVTVYYVNFLFELKKIYPLMLVRFFFILIPLLSPLLFYMEDTSYILSNTRNYFRWWPYTDIFHANDIEQKAIVTDREYYVDEHMYYQYLKQE